METGDRRSGDREAAIRAGPDQRGELVARHRDQLVGSGQIGACGGQCGIGLLELGAGVEAIGDPVGHELLGRAAQSDGRIQNVALGIEAGQIGIGGGDRGGQREIGLVLLDPGGVDLRGSRGQRGPVTAPQIDVVVEIQRRLAIIFPATGEELGWDAANPALLFEIGAALRIEGGQQPGARRLRHALRHAESRGGSGGIGRTLQSLLDQSCELGIAIGVPPAVGRPCAGALSREALLGGDARGRAHFRTGAEIGNRTGGQRDKQAKRGQGPKQGSANRKHSKTVPFGIVFAMCPLHAPLSIQICTI